jgi:uncharacterized membrane protein YdjX (TVP38/TMEM64 family)
MRHAIERLGRLLTPRRLLLLLLLALLGLAGLLLLRYTGEALTPTGIRLWLGGLGLWGPVVLLLALTAVLIIPIVPASVLHLGAGLAFGPWLGLALVTLADFVGAGAGFLIARRWGMRLVEQRLGPEAQARVESLTARMSWRTLLLLRLLPGPAYPLVSLAAGCSRLDFWSYSFASLAGVFPALALLVLAGDLVTSSPYLAFALVVALVGGMALAGRLLARPAGANATEPAERDPLERA